MEKGDFLQVVHVLDGELVLVHGKAGPTALRVCKAGLLGKDLRHEAGTVLFTASFHAAHLLYHQDARFFAFYP